MRLFIFTQQPHHKLKATQNLRFSHVLVFSYVSDMLIVMLSSPLISPQQQSPRNDFFKKKKAHSSIIPSFSEAFQKPFLLLKFKNPVKQYVYVTKDLRPCEHDARSAAVRKDNQSDSEEPAFGRRPHERHLCASYRGGRPVSFRSLFEEGR